MVSSFENCLGIKERFKAPCKRTQHCWPTTSNIVGCYMLRPFAHPVACCCAKFETGQTFQPTTPNIFFWSVCTALPTLLGPCTPITHGLQRHTGCILPTMHCRSQHCWELLHPFAHHCQHARNNFQHCWRNNVGSCCVCTEPKMRKEFNSHRFFFVPATDSLFCTQIWPPWRHVKTGNQEIFSGQNLYCTRII